MVQSRGFPKILQVKSCGKSQNFTPARIEEGKNWESCFNQAIQDQLLTYFYSIPIGKNYGGKQGGIYLIASRDHCGFSRYAESWERKSMRKSVLIR